MYLVLYSRTRVCSLICLLTQEVRYHIGKNVYLLLYIYYFPIKVKRCIVNSETKRNKLKKQIIKDQLLRERMVNNHSRTEKEKKHYGKVI